MSEVSNPVMATLDPTLAARSTGLQNLDGRPCYIGQANHWLSCQPMNAARIALAAILITVSCDARDKAATKPAESKMTPKSHIPREELVQIFDGIRQQTKWNIDGDMLWGYFFIDDGADRLKLIRRELEGQGYRFVDLREVEMDGKKTGQYMLHVEKVETHNIDSLDTRNGELDALAAKHGVKEYDGMDVGPVNPTTTRPAK
jgi:hypothetical protein